MLVLGVVLVAGNAIFVSAEFSLVALDQASVEKRAAGKEPGAARVLKAIRSLSTQLSGTQVGITLTTILLGYTTQTTIASLLTTLLGDAGLAQAAATAAAVIVAAVFINLVSMLFGELVPKNMAMAHPMWTAGKVAPAQMFFTTLFRPLIVVLNGSANWLLHRLGIEPKEEISSARSATELAALVRHSAEEGTLDTSTASLLTKSIHIGDLSAVDVMTDRGLVATLPRTAMASDVVELAETTGHSRFPVIGDGFDDVLGLVSLRRAIAVPWERRDKVPVMSSSLLAPAPRVPETVDLRPLLVRLRDEGLQAAVVVDEYGGVSGLVTLEDVVEEIVGDVADEHDRRRLGIRPLPNGSFLVPGRLRPDELKERTGITVPDDGPYETLAGLVMARLERIPEQGDRVDVDGVGLMVTRMHARRVLSLTVTPAPEPTDDDEEEGR